MAFRDYIKRGLEYVFTGRAFPTVHVTVQTLSSSEKLKGKKVIITGGGRGLGFAMAKKFVSEGAEVLISGRNAERLKSSAKEIGCQCLQQDVTDVDSFTTFLSKADEMLDGVNCLVTNAGISEHEGSIRNVTPEQFDGQINTNLRGSYFLAKEFVNLMEGKQRKGEILMVSSEMGFLSDNLPYGITKAAINSFVRGLAYEVIKSGIRVNGIAPGVTASDMTGYKEDGNLYLPTNMSNRVYLPEEVAEVACFLLSDASGCVSGQIIACDEGKVINYRR